MKRWIAILGPQQVVLISNTHTPGKHRDFYLKIKRGQEGVRKKEALVKQRKDG